MNCVNQLPSSDQRWGNAAVCLFPNRHAYFWWLYKQFNKLQSSDIRPLWINSKSNLFWCNKRVKREQSLQFNARTQTYSSPKRRTMRQTKAKISHGHCLGTIISFNCKHLQFATRPDKWAKHLSECRIQFVDLN